MLEKNEGSDVGHDHQRKESVDRYASIIERHLRSESSLFSESDIVKEVLKVRLDTQDDIPSSTDDLYTLTEIRESLRKLVAQRKIVQTLVQDPLTKEETLYYVIRKTEE
jgi:hypothetical protein